MGTGNRIREIRELRKMTAERLAQQIGVTKSTITRYETGSIEKIPYISFLKILIALEATPEEILPAEELELVEQTDELRGLYKILGEMKKEMISGLMQLSPGEADIVDGVVQGLLAQHKE